MSLMTCQRCTECVGDMPTLCPHARHLGMNAAGTFAEFIAVPTKECIVIPDSISARCSAMLEPLAVVAHTLDRLRSRLTGARVAIIGPGPIGLLHLLAVQTAGAKAIVFGLAEDTERLALARDLGAEAAVVVTAEPRESAELENLVPGGFDLVIETAGLGSAVELAFTIIKPGGEVKIKGVRAGSLADPLPIVRKALCVSGEAGAARRHYTEALAWVIERRVDPSAVVTHWFSLIDAMDAFKVSRSRAGIAAVYMDRRDGVPPGKEEG